MYSIKDQLLHNYWIFQTSWTNSKITLILKSIYCRNWYHYTLYMQMLLICFREFYQAYWTAESWNHFEGFGMETITIALETHFIVLQNEPSMYNMEPNSWFYNIFQNSSILRTLVESCGTVLMFYQWTNTVSYQTFLIVASQEP